MSLYICSSNIGCVLMLFAQVKMVTGDQLAIAVETSRRLGTRTEISDGKEGVIEPHNVSKDLAHQV